MMRTYEKLISLAKEGAYGDERILEENKLLNEFSSDENRDKIKVKDYKILDDLITALFLANNIFLEYKKNIENLQSFLRDNL